MSPVLLGLVALATAAVTAGGAYLVQRRSKSGRVDTTEAAELWLEGREIRKELRGEIGDLLAQVKAARDEADSVGTELRAARQEIGGLRTTIAQYEEEMDALRTQVAVLKGLVKE